MSAKRRAMWGAPYMTVRDVEKAIGFYQKAFGFTPGKTVSGEDGSIWHGELSYQDQLIMVGKEGDYENPSKAPMTSGVTSPVMLYLYCLDVDAFYAHAISAGAVSVLAPVDMFWGDRMCQLKDIDGYIWMFAKMLG